MTAPSTASTSPVPEVAKILTFHSLSAGSTTIMPSGKVLKFGGLIEKQDGGTKVGKGTYSTNVEEEISWLESLCKQPAPQVWKEVTEEAGEGSIIAPAAVANGVMNDQKVVTEEITERAVISTKPEVVNAIDKAATVTGAATLAARAAAMAG